MVQNPSTSRRRRNLCEIGTPLDSMANSLNATFESIFDETPPKRLKHPVFLERKDDPVCRSANARLGHSRPGRDTWKAGNVRYTGVNRTSRGHRAIDAFDPGCVRTPQIDNEENDLS
jgi:hypothetical protein